MTALLTLERARSTTSYTPSPTTPPPASRSPACAAGERMTVADLLRALLLRVANDAAVTLAVDVARLASARSCG